MVVDYAHCLHEGITNGRANEFEPAFFQVLAHGFGLCHGGRLLRKGFECFLRRLAANKLPDILVKEPELFLHAQKIVCVNDSSINFQLVADGTSVGQQPLFIPQGESKNFFASKPEKAFR